MDTVEILMKYHGEINKIYAENTKAIAHLDAQALFHNYVMKFKLMVKGGVMSIEEYDELTDKMLYISMNKIK